MKLNDRYNYSDQKVPISIDSAVEIACNPSVYDYARGRMERTEEAVEATAELLGRLIQELHDSHTLTDKRVLRILGSRFEKAE